MFLFGNNEIGYGLEEKRPMYKADMVLVGNGHGLYCDGANVTGAIANVL